MSERASRLAAFKNEGKNVQDLRRKRVEVSVALRKQAREDNLLKRRAFSPPADSQDPQDNSEIPPLEDIVAGLQSKDEETLLHACRSGRRMLSRDQNPPISTLVDTGCVPLLVAALGHSNLEVQFEAAWAITNIASGDQIQTRAVIDAGAIPPLVRLLGEPSGSESAKEQAAWALGNVAGDGAEARDAVLAWGALASLLPILAPPYAQPADALLKTAVWTFSNFCRNKNPIVDLKLVSPGLPAIVHLLCHTNSDILADACWALSYLTDGPNDRIEAVQSIPGLIENAVKLLSHEQVCVKTPALRTVGNMVTGSDEQTERVLKTDALQRIGALLSASKPSLVKEAAWAICNVMAGTPEQIQKCIDAGLLPPLINVIKNGEPRCQKEAAWAITNLTTGGGTEQLSSLIASGAIAPYGALLEAKEPQTILVVLEGFSNLLKAAQSVNQLDQLCVHLEEEEVLDKLEALQKHSNDNIYKKVIDILDTYFQAEDVNEDTAPKKNTVEFEFGTTTDDIGQF